MSKTGRSIRVQLGVVRHLGWRWVAFRGWQALRQKTGRMRRKFPLLDFHRVLLADFLQAGVPDRPEEYVAYRRASPATFFFLPGSPPDAALLQSLMGGAGVAGTLSIADDYARGRFLYYSHHHFDLGWPPDWLLNPFTGGRHENRTHWCDYPTFSPSVAPASSRCGHGLEARATLGDIKDVWEPSRFACGYWLVRAYALTRDERYPTAFWDLFESWCVQNPPNRGPNWKCGQETALRTLAWCFALYAFWNAEATTPTRVAGLVKMIAIQAERIAGHIAYAVSQKNNHGLSEAAGLLTVGLLFPELRGAARWEALGRRVLEREVARQIYDDGSYVQHSMNYHRVMLHVCLWAIRLAELNGRPLSAALAERVAKAGEFLRAMLDEVSGRVPNYGANDGALVLPLAPCDYTDYRPTIQAAVYAATGRAALPAGPWDEMTLWLFGSVPPPPSAAFVVSAKSRLNAGKMPLTTTVKDGPVPQREGEAPAEPAHSVGPLTSRRFDSGGYYTLRGPESWCMIRCHRYRDRPGHVDMMHVDLWWRGINVLGDSGSYRYYDPSRPDLERYFKDVQAHNTLQIGDEGPLYLAGRFLWLPWPRARCLEFAPNRWVGESRAYDRPPWRVVHRRTVERLENGHWRIRDEATGAGPRRIVLRWHLPDAAVELDSASRRIVVRPECGVCELTFDGPVGLHLSLLRTKGDRHEGGGWRSDYYADRTPRSVVVVEAECDLPQVFSLSVRLASD